MHMSSLLLHCLHVVIVCSTSSSNRRDITFILANMSCRTSIVVSVLGMSPPTSLVSYTWIMVRLNLCLSLTFDLRPGTMRLCQSNDYICAHQQQVWASLLFPSSHLCPGFRSLLSFISLDFLLVYSFYANTSPVSSNYLPLEAMLTVLSCLVSLPGNSSCSSTRRR